MQLKNYSFAVLTVTLLTILNTQYSYAVSITYNTNENSKISFDKVPYTHGNRVSESWIKQPELLRRGGTPGLRRLLKSYFPDWIFSIAPPVAGNNSLKGEFSVKQYYACGNLTDCGNSLTSIVTNGVGARFDVDYIPGQGEQQFSSQFKWIGRVTDNHSIEPFPNGTYGLREDRIDNNGRADNPFSISLETDPNSFTSFSDRPYRDNPQDDHYWNGELFLAREVGVKTVVIYDGISWGWKNQTKSNSACSTSGSQCPPPPPRCTGNSGGGGCNINSLVNRVRNQSGSPTSVPESTSAFGLLALAAWGVVKALKIRFDKES